jgi:DNA-binding NtrC family response regulator
MSAKVLIVDDEVEFASALAERLTLRNYDVKAVYHVEDAITAVQSDPPDVVLLDLRMPGIGGFEVLKTIKKFDPTIEVILLTGQPKTEVTDEGIPTGLFDYIMKPVNIGELIAKINNATEKRNLSKHS